MAKEKVLIDSQNDGKQRTVNLYAVGDSGRSWLIEKPQTGFKQYVSSLEKAEVIFRDKVNTVCD